MWQIATTITQFIANVGVVAGRVEMLDRNRKDSCGNLECGFWFCTGSADNGVQYDKDVSTQQGKLATLTHST